MPVIASSNRGNTVIVPRQSAVSVERQATATLQVEAARTVRTVTEATRAVEVSAPGPQGAQGLPGLSGAGLLAPINFAFGDASPAAVAVLAEASEVTRVSLQIEQAFDGVGARIQLGTADEPGLLLDDWQSDPASEDVYETVPRAELPANTSLILTLTPGTGASQGRGQFVLTIVPTT